MNIFVIVDDEIFDLVGDLYKFVFIYFCFVIVVYLNFVVIINMVNFCGFFWVVEIVFYSEIFWCSEFFMGVEWKDDGWISGRDDFDGCVRYGCFDGGGLFGEGIGRGGYVVDGGGFGYVVVNDEVFEIEVGLDCFYEGCWDRIVCYDIFFEIFWCREGGCVEWFEDSDEYGVYVVEICSILFWIYMNGGMGIECGRWEVDCSIGCCGGYVF